MNAADAVTVVVNFAREARQGGIHIRVCRQSGHCWDADLSPGVRTYVYTAPLRSGQRFWDHGGDVHIVRNEGTTPATLVVTFLDVPPGRVPRIDEPRPGNCPF